VGGGKCVCVCLCEREREGERRQERAPHHSRDALAHGGPTSSGGAAAGTPPCAAPRATCAVGVRFSREVQQRGSVG